MKRPNLQQYLKECQKGGIFQHTVSATDNGDNFCITIHPAFAEGETLDFLVKGNELKQLHVNEELNKQRIPTKPGVSGTPLTK